jgi:succinylglutamate desuccinylase
VAIVGGIHGNEPAGVQAATRVVERLIREQAVIRGRVVALAGNLAALQKGVRFVKEDLNRRFTPPLVEALEQGPDPSAVDEAREQAELYGALRPWLTPRGGQTVVLDLHTASGFGSPFIVPDGPPEARRLADALLVSQVHGLGRLIQGTFTSWAATQEHLALGFEGGQHQDPRTPRVLEALVWQSLLVLGVVAPIDVPDGGHQRRVLEALALGHPRAVEVVYRHAITPENGFKMLPGFVNLQPVWQGQVLAHDHRGEVRCPGDGWLLLPLYQGLGSEGFLIGAELAL